MFADELQLILVSVTAITSGISYQSNIKGHVRALSFLVDF